MVTNQTLPRPDEKPEELTDARVNELLAQYNLREQWEGRLRAGQHHGFSAETSRRLTLDWLRSWLTQRQEEDQRVPAK